MAFQVNSNATALNVYNNLGVHQAKSSASLARISSGLKAAGGGDIASQGTAATRNVALQGTQSSISQVQSAINQLQAADAGCGAESGYLIDPNQHQIQWCCLHRRITT
jgi:flagellin-like hook-associated protein FlgL